MKVHELSKRPGIINLQTAKLILACHVCPSFVGQYMQRGKLVILGRGKYRTFKLRYNFLPEPKLPNSDASINFQRWCWTALSVYAGEFLVRTKWTTRNKSLGAVSNDHVIQFLLRSGTSRDVMQSLLNLAFPGTYEDWFAR